MSSEFNVTEFPLPNNYSEVLQEYIENNTGIIDDFTSNVKEILNEIISWEVSLNASFIEVTDKGDHVELYIDKSTLEQEFDNAQ